MGPYQGELEEKSCKEISQHNIIEGVNITNMKRKGDIDYILNTPSPQPDHAQPAQPAQPGPTQSGSGNPQLAQSGPALPAQPGPAQSGNPNHGLRAILPKPAQPGSAQPTPFVKLARPA